jgi:phosphoribosylamine--glycine ligase
VLTLAKKEAVDLTVVGPEVPLVKGIVDAFQAEGLRIFGPTAGAARLEGSKAFSKDFMTRYGIPTAAFQTFRELNPALTYLEKTGAPVVVKASGLAAGKGAVVCQTLTEAREAVESMLGPNAIFGEAGSEVVIEEFMDGEEASVFAVCDGKNFTLLPTAQDHKRIFDNDMGPNTGGMGAYSPAPIMTPALLERTCKEVIRPTLDGMQKEGHPYQGVLYVGLMLTSKGPKVVEFNCRLGDPETQAVLPVYAGDLLELVLAAAEGKISDTVEFPKANRSAAIIVLASKGYPGSYPSGLPIQGLLEANTVPGVHVVHAGTKSKDGAAVTAGGRVLGVVGQADSLSEALKAAYQGVDCVRFEGMQYRKDIGQRGLKALG